MRGPFACLTFLALGALLLLATASHAQVTDPAVVQFLPSPDHDAIASSGQPIVSRYDLEVYAVGASAPFQVTNMGKPAPTTDGNVYYDFAGQIASWPLPGGTYESRVAAVGPFGTSRSAPSNPFTMSPPGVTCAYTLTPATLSASAGGGTFTISISTGATCTWLVASASSWFAVSPTTGLGSGTLTVTVSANTSSSARSEMFSVGGQAATVLQGAATVTCTYSISPTALSFGAAGGTSAVNVGTSPGCAWTAASSAAWANVTPGGSSGSGTVTVSVDPNTSATPRSTSVRVAGQLITVMQDAGACGYSVSPSTLQVAPEGGSPTLQVSAPAGCAWTASSNATWAMVSPASSSGTGPVTLSVEPNPSPGGRAAIVTVGGQTVTVTQSGVTCTFAVSPISFTAPATGASASVKVTTPPGCSWSASWSAPWITGAPAGGSGSAAINLAVAPNTTVTARRASLLVAGQLVIVDQPGAPCSFTVPTTPLSIPGQGGTASVSVASQAGCSWTAVSGATWLVVSPATSSVAGPVTVSAAANSSSSARSTTLTVAGQAIQVTQTGSTCTFTVAPTSVNLDGLGKTATVDVTAPEGCAWTAATGATWFTLSPFAGSGTGKVTITSASKGTSNVRVAVAKIAQQSVTVTQAVAAACAGTISPASLNIPQAGGAGQFTLKAACNWMVVKDASWITVVNPVGTGNATVKFSVPANPGRSSRRGTLTVAGQVFRVRQEGQKPGQVKNVTVTTSSTR